MHCGEQLPAPCQDLGGAHADDNSGGGGPVLERDRGQRQEGARNLLHHLPPVRDPESVPL